MLPPVTKDDPLTAYLARIGVGEPVALDARGLARVQSAHRQAIPFENLAIMTGGAIACDSASVFDKLVTQRWGGFCFEHNRLFADMLTLMGFDVRLLLARVLLGNPGDLPPRTHCLVLACIGNDEWIADAGFGGGYAPPMILAGGAQVRSTDGALHRLTRIDGQPNAIGDWLLERHGPIQSTDGRGGGDGDWHRQYAFDCAQIVDADMALGCHWSATHPSSRFVNHHVVSLCLPAGFASMVDRDLTVWQRDGDTSTRRIETPGDYQRVLADIFGIELGEKDAAQLPIFAGLAS